MNVFTHVEQRIRAALAAVQAAGGLPADLAVGDIDVGAKLRFDVEPVKDAKHGDVASNIAMVVAAKLRDSKKNDPDSKGRGSAATPRDIAEKLAAELKKEPGFDKVEVAGPGFLNITLALRLWQDVVGTILKAGGEYGRSSIGGGDPTNVEYVSANPTGPMHVGHCRGAVFGDALANLLSFAGYQVTREYYINDAGGQVDVLARSAYLRYREALGEDIGEIPEGLYPGDYLKPVGEALAKAHGRSLLGRPEREWLPDVRQAAIAAMLAQIKGDLAALNIRHDVFFSERSLSERSSAATTTGNRDEVAETVKELRAKGLVFEGRLEKPKGHDAEEWEDREQTLFKATAFGDDVDRALMKSDGSYTYFAADMAYHHNKLARGFRHLINVFGADHAGYVKRMKAAVAALSGGSVDLDIKVCQLVRLLRAGAPVKMSKRSGTFVTLREVVDEVGRDPVRFMMLYRKNDATLDFDLAKVIEQSKDNPVFYVQYAHARAHSVFRNAREAFPDVAAELRSDVEAKLRFDLDPLGPEILKAPTELLVEQGEIDLIKRLAQFPRLVEGAARAHEPHRLAFYLNDLAADFHTLWSRGNDLPHLRFIQANERRLTMARLALVRATAQVITSGLGILGVHAPSEMR